MESIKCSVCGFQIKEKFAKVGLCEFCGTKIGSRKKEITETIHPTETTITQNTTSVTITRRNQLSWAIFGFTLLTEDGAEHSFKSGEEVRFTTDKTINTVMMRADMTFLNKRNQKITFTLNENNPLVNIEIWNNSTGDWEAQSTGCPTPSYYN